jgi:hypothetical protein
MKNFAEKNLSFQHSLANLKGQFQENIIYSLEEQNTIFYFRLTKQILFNGQRIRRNTETEKY